MVTSAIDTDAPAGNAAFTRSTGAMARTINATGTARYNWPLRHSSTHTTRREAKASSAATGRARNSNGPAETTSGKGLPAACTENSSKRACSARRAASSATLSTAAASSGAVLRETRTVLLPRHRTCPRSCSAVSIQRCSSSRPISRVAPAGGTTPIARPASAGNLSAGASMRATSPSVSAAVGTRTCARRNSTASLSCGAAAATHDHRINRKVSLRTLSPNVADC
ncbi:Uncharacterised protein [Achromobacter xylosoxidans]|nr:Uncharacterised protein [Achromobacter xylosoxidans]